MFDTFKSSLVSAKQVGETTGLQWLIAGVLAPEGMDQWPYDRDSTVAAVKAAKPSASDMVSYYSDVFAERPDILLEFLRIEKRITVVQKLLTNLFTLNVAEENIPLAAEACDIIASRGKSLQHVIPLESLHNWIANFGDPAIRAFTGPKRHPWKLDAGSDWVLKSYTRYLEQVTESAEEYLNRLPVTSASDRLKMLEYSFSRVAHKLDVFEVAQWFIDRGIQVNYAQFLDATRGWSIVSLKDAFQTYSYFQAGLTDAPESEWYPYLVRARKELNADQRSGNDIPLDSIDQHLALPSCDLYSFGIPRVQKPIGVIDAELLLKLLHVDSVDEHCPLGALRYLSRICAFTRDAAELAFKANKDMPLFHVEFDVAEELLADKERLLDEGVSEFWGTMFDNHTAKVKHLPAEVISELREEILSSPKLSLQPLLRHKWLNHVVFYGMKPARVAAILAERVASRIIESSGTLAKDADLRNIFPVKIQWDGEGPVPTYELTQQELWDAFIFSIFKQLVEQPLEETKWSLGLLTDLSAGFKVGLQDVLVHISFQDPSTYLHGLQVIMRLVGYSTSGIASSAAIDLGHLSAGHRITSAAEHDEELLDYLLHPFLEKGNTASLPRPMRGSFRNVLIARDKIPLEEGEFFHVDLTEENPVFQRIIAELGGQEDALMLLQELGMSWSGYLGDLIETAKLSC